jgi:hypothetical protein
MTWLSRHPVVAWTLAWGLSGLSFQVAGVFDDHSNGPGWLAFVIGTVCWAVAGSTTVHNIGAEMTPKRTLTAACIWGGAFIWLASVALPFGEWASQSRFGSVIPAGFAGMVIAWSVAAALAVSVTSRVVKREPGLVRPLAVAFRWGFAFFFGGYIGVPFASILGQTCDAMIGEVVGRELALALGWTTASLLAGVLAATAALTMSGSRDPRPQHERRVMTPHSRA